MNPQMRMLILLAVLWGAGSLLLAAESPSTPKPAAAEKPAAEKPAAEKPATDERKAAAEESGSDPGQGKGSIAEQAEAALKAAAEADPAGASSEPPKDDDAESNEEAQAPPAAAAAKASPQRFVPSEQVRADFDVSFPIDI